MYSGVGRFSNLNLAWRRITRAFVALFVVFVLLTASSLVMAANGGTIISLTASNANPSDVSATLLAGSVKINNSNVTFQILDSSSSLVGSYGPISVTLLAAQSTVVSWSWPVSGTGPYSVTACWSRGVSTKCNLDTKTTSFSAVPTLGPLFMIVGAVFVGAWLLRFRRQQRMHLVANP